MIRPSKVEADPLAEAFNIIAQKHPGYQPRPQQVEYSRAVKRAFDEGGKLIIEGPTGCGKSFGYLLPAILSGKKTLVVTANLNLQDQLVDKDLPFLQNVRPFRYALVKGRSNYVCHDRVADFEESLLAGGAPDEEKTIAAWSKLTTTGDRKESPTNDAKAWRRLSVTSEECLGSDCDHVGRCFALKALMEASQADIIVANYHLLFSHLKVLKMTEGTTRILPLYQAIVMDEAHAAVAIAREYFGFKLSANAIRRLVQMSGTMIDSAAELLKASADFFSELRKYRNSEAGNRRIRRPDAVPIGKWGTLVRALDMVRSELLRHDDEPRAAKLARLARQHGDEIRSAMGLSGIGKSPAVYYVEDENGQSILYGKPLDPSEDIRGAFPAASIITSATLTVGGSFSAISSELGLVGQVERAVPSPYDWPKQAALVVPKLPDPADPASRVVIDQAIRDVVAHAKGRTLVLCTSNKRVGEVKAALSGCGYRVLAQNEMALAQLVEEFRNDISSVLVGTTSLWKGVDVAGEALSCVVIDKLPFDVWTDPFVEARREYNGEKGWKMYVADAVVRFRQACGRLIRNEKDRGVIVLLDGRVRTKNYGTTFLRSLPSGIGVSSDIADVGRFLESA